MKSLFPEKQGTKGGIHLNRKAVSFFLCLVIAILFWLLNALSKNYTSNISIPVKYINMPKGKVVTNPLPSNINGLIKAKGYRLLSYKIKPLKDTLQFDVYSFMMIGNDSMSYIVTSQVVEKLSKQIKGNTSLVEIKPDTLFFYFSKSVSKTIPVKLNISLTFNEQYRLSKKINVEPQSITITGDAYTVNKINLAETEELSFDKVSKNISSSVALKLRDNQKIKLSHNEVKFNINVDKFTERSIEVPIVIRNTPKNMSLRLFPEKVTVKFLTPLNRYEEANESMFRAEVDAADIKGGSNTKLKISLSSKPDWVENVTVSPTKAEYIIKK